MNNLKSLVIVILTLCASPLLGQETYGSWEIDKSEANGHVRYKAFSKAQDIDMYFIVACVPNVDPRDTFLIILEQKTSFEPMEKTTIRMTAVFDENDPIKIDWLFNNKVLLMFDSQWFAEKMRFSNSMTLHFRDLYGKKEINFSLDDFDKTASKLEEYCGYKFNAIPQ